jgi:hypothetical protein
MHAFGWRLYSVMFFGILRSLLTEEMLLAGNGIEITTLHYNRKKGRAVNSERNCIYIRYRSLGKVCEVFSARRKNIILVHNCSCGKRLMCFALPLPSKRKILHCLLCHCVLICLWPTD